MHICIDNFKCSSMWNMFKNMQSVNRYSGTCMKLFIFCIDLICYLLYVSMNLSIILQGSDILSHLDQEEYESVIKILENAILATDLALYFRYLVWKKNVMTFYFIHFIDKMSNKMCYTCIKTLCFDVYVHCEHLMQIFDDINA